MAYYIPARLSICTITWVQSAKYDCLVVPIRYKDKISISEKNHTKYIDNQYKKHTTVIIDNKPQKGFILDAKNGKILHPLGYIISISQSAIHEIIDTCKINCGVIDDELVAIEKDRTVYFITQTSEMYKAADSTDISDMIDFSTLKPGDVFVKGTGEINEFFGKFEGINIKALSCIMRQSDYCNSASYNNFNNHLDTKSETIYIYRVLRNADSTLTLDQYNKGKGSVFASNELYNLSFYSKKVLISKVLFNTQIPKDVYFSWLCDYHTKRVSKTGKTPFNYFCISNSNITTCMVFDICETQFSTKNIFSSMKSVPYNDVLVNYCNIGLRAQRCSEYYVKGSSGQFKPIIHSHYRGGENDYVPAVAFKNKEVPLFIFDSVSHKSIGLSMAKDIYRVTFMLDRTKTRDPKAQPVAQAKEVKESK